MSYLRGTDNSSTGVGPTGPTGPAPFSAPVPYDPTATYRPISGALPASCVTFQGSAYVAVATSTNVAPGTDPTKWSLLASKGDPGVPGSGGSGSGSVQAVLFAGAVAANQVFQAGIGYPTATTITSITITAKTAPVGAATLIDWYVQGPGTSNALSSIKATSTLSAGSYQSSPLTVSIGMQPFDTLVPQVRTVGSTPAADVSAYITDNPAIAGAAQPPAPANVTASIAGQPNGTALVTWTPITPPSGQTVSGYTVVSSTGVTVSALSSASSATVSGLASTSMTFTVSATTNLGGTSPASLPSNAVIPTTSSQRLTTAEQQGQGWSADSNCTVSYDSAVTPTGSASGLVGSLKVIATAAGSAQTVLTRHVTVTPSEASKPLSAIFRNDAAVALTFGIWVAYFDSTGAYASSSAVAQTTIAAGATGTITTTASAPANATTGSVQTQGVATVANQQYHVGSVSWG